MDSCIDVVRCRSQPPLGGHNDQGHASTWAPHRGPFMCEGGGLRAHRSIRAGRGRAVASLPRDVSHAPPHRAVYPSPWPLSTDDGARPRPTRTHHLPPSQHDQSSRNNHRCLTRRDDKVWKSIARLLALLPQHLKQTVLLIAYPLSNRTRIIFKKKKDFSSI